MQAVLQLFYIMNKAIQLPQNKVNAFTFVCPRKINLFMPLSTVIFCCLFKGKQILYSLVVCHYFNKKLPSPHWAVYFDLHANQLTVDLDHWSRRRIKMCYWRQWRALLRNSPYKSTQFNEIGC